MSWTTTARPYPRPYAECGRYLDWAKRAERMVEWLDAVPPAVIYLAVGLVIGLESVGIPLPGEIMLISASIAAAQHVVNPVWLAIVAATGAIVGDSVGYAVGSRHGRSLLGWLGRKAPKHFGPKRVAAAERAFARWGAGAVFGGRFVALLRILAGPLAGVLGMPYGKFLLANVCGGITWAGSVTTVAYCFGLVAEQWIRGFSWVALAITVLITALTMLYLRRRADQDEDEDEGEDATEAVASNGK